MSPELLLALVERCRGRMLRVLRWKHVPPEDAEDVIQDMILALLATRWDKVRNPEGFLLGVLVRKCGVYWYKRLRLQLVPLGEGVDERVQDPDGGAAASLELRDMIDKALPSLTPGQRDLLRLRYLEGKRYKDLERELALTHGRCRRGVQRGLKAARQTLEAPRGTGRAPRPPQRRGAG